MTDHRVVIVGAGFAGLQLAKSLKNSSTQVTIIDRRNHHLFQPLLYQVATTVLATSEIAWPIRALFRNRPDVKTILGEAVGIDTSNMHVHLNDGVQIPYDTLVLATGARHAYFGRDDWEPFAPGLKTLEDATTIRRRLLLAFEKAELESDARARQALLTFAIIGAGPTGVELAGIIAKLAHKTLVPEFRSIDTRTAKILLIEAGPRILPVFPVDLSDYATRALTRMGVEVRIGNRVTACDQEGVAIGDLFVPTKTVLWAAGVQASKAADWVGASADRIGRAVVAADLTVPCHPEIFVIGDTAAVSTQDGKTVPGIAPAAKQQGKYVAAVIRARLKKSVCPAPFRYKHLGSLATIGPSEAIIHFRRIHLKGWIAWWIWGLAHIYFLIGSRSRFAVALSWLYVFMTGHHSARLITQKETLKDET